MLTMPPGTSLSGAFPKAMSCKRGSGGRSKGADWTPIRLGLFRGESLVGGAAILRRTLPLVGPFYYAPRVGRCLDDWSRRGGADGAAGSD